MTAAEHKVKWLQCERCGAHLRICLKCFKIEVAPCDLHECKEGA